MVVSFILTAREMEVLYPLGSALLNIVITALIWLAAFVIKKRNSDSILQMYALIRA